MDPGHSDVCLVQKHDSCKPRRRGLRRGRDGNLTGDNGKIVPFSHIPIFFFFNFFLLQFICGGAQLHQCTLLLLLLSVSCILIDRDSSSDISAHREEQIWGLQYSYRELL